MTEFDDLIRAEVQKIHDGAGVHANWTAQCICGRRRLIDNGVVVCVYCRKIDCTCQSLKED